ncbi:MAG: META domain-containing protein [Burkholderiales bacterium]
MRYCLFTLSLTGFVALAGCSAAPHDNGAARVRTPEAAIGAWHWEATVTPVERIGTANPDRYTLELQPGGVALVRADCNRGRGSYAISEGRITFGAIATTRMACPPGSLDSRYLKDLQRATIFFVEGGKLFFDLPADSGTMRFARGK